MPRRDDGTIIQGGLNSPFNVCTASWSSMYLDSEDEVREIIRTSGVRFVDSGGADVSYPDNPGGISGTMQTRYTNGSVNLFDLFKGDDNFAGFVPVDKQDLHAVLMFIAHRKAERELATRLAAEGVPHA